ncbi:hypothetical protein Pint_05195 [Pistacia integerrima]|uniref:Uncharacterized protein n=1 Tax=Pistacia integerrima TaxID=434235 RepID=A0ACC0Z5B6_9ROSI|nr:hypothetical protein Pint_05195 [Pistacia integerrima]
MVVTSGRKFNKHSVLGASVNRGKAAGGTVIIPFVADMLLRSRSSKAGVDLLQANKGVKNSSHPLPSDGLSHIKEEFGLVDTLSYVEGYSPKSLFAGWVAVSKTLLKSGVSVPLHRLISAILECFDVVPLQLMTNTYLCIISMRIVYQRSGIGGLTINELINIY